MAFRTAEELDATAKVKLLEYFGPKESEIVAQYGQDAYDRLVDNALTHREVHEFVRFVRMLPE